MAHTGGGEKGAGRREHLSWVRDYFKKIYKTSVLENFLGLELVKVGKGKVTYRTKITDKQCNLYGTIHGGTLASVADVAMGVACVTLGKRVVTIDLNISYLKNAPVGSTLTATGEVVGDGRKIMRVEGRIFHGKELLVRSQASYFVTGEFHKDDYPFRAA